MTDEVFSKVYELWTQGTQDNSDPAEWADNKARVKLWSKQREICRSVVRNKKTAVPSGHGIGKSLTAATIADWWVDTHPIGEAFVVSTAPSAPQIHAILWEEMRKMHHNAQLAGEIQLSDNWIIGRTLVGMGRKPHDYNQYAFQGIHRKYVLAILDEACGIPEWLWNAVETITTGEHCRILAIGNPDDPSSHFAKVCKPKSGWNVLPISVLDSPNFTGEEVDPEVADMLTSREWVEDKRTAWGEDSPIWEAKILGRFPQLDEHAVIPLAWVQAAQDRWKDWVNEGMPPQRGKKIIAADIARFGVDQTVLAHRQGNVCSRIEKFRKLDTEASSDIIMQRMSKHEDMAVVDVIGIGAGVVDKLTRNEYHVRSFNAAARTNATDSSREWGFPTLRSAVWWHMRQLLDPSRGEDIVIPDDEDLAADLISPRWSIMIGAKIYVESKDEIKKRIGRSTDVADAVIMAFWYTSSALDDDDYEAINWTDVEVPGGAIEWAGPEFVGAGDDLFVW